MQKLPGNIQLSFYVLIPVVSYGSKELLCARGCSARKEQGEKQEK